MTPRLARQPASSRRGAYAKIWRTFLLLATLPLHVQAQDCEWESGLFTPAGTDGPVHALAEFSSGGTSLVYAGGDFQSAGGVLASNIAAWSGTEWSAVGTGTGTDGPVHALAVFNAGTGNALYAGGAFTTAGGGSTTGVARWSGTVWSSLGGAVNGRVLALLAFNDGGGEALYAGGEFTTAEGITVNRVARWNGNLWLPVGDGFDDTVRAFQVYDSGGGPQLYAGGDFVVSGNTTLNYIARWNGSDWVGAGGGFDDRVTALGTFDEGGGEALFAAGEFVVAGLLAANRIARWNGSSWTALGSGVVGQSCAMAVFNDGSGDALYVGGDFPGAGAAAAANVARWNGISWNELGDGTDGPVHAFLVADDGAGAELFAAGDFSTAGEASSGAIAAWSGAAWRAVGDTTTLNGPVLDMAVYDTGSGTHLFVCGDFTEAAGASAGFVAQWTGSQWLPAGGGMDDLVLALEVFDDGGGDELYAAGTFARADGIPATRVARFGPTGFWNSVGSGIPGAVFDLTTYNDGSGPGLFAAGFFSSAGGVSASNVAKWQSGSWSAVGSGTNTVVRALAVFDGALYAAGDFVVAGGISASRVARWDGANWSALGTGLNNRAFAALGYDGPDGPSLYVGGAFTAAGGLTTNRVARWDGAGWSQLDTGLDNNALDLFGFDDGLGPALFAAGEFTAPGNHVARWDGSTWAPLATELNDIASKFASFDDGNGPALYVGGSFSVAGSAVSSAVAKRIGPSFPVITKSPDDDERCAGAIAAFSVAADGTPPFTYQWSHNGTELPGAQQPTLVMTNIQVDDSGEYQAEVTDACGIVTSEAATLTVIEAASIVTQPKSQLACIGAAVILTVEALGSEPRTYQWRRNGFPIEGANGGFLVVDPVTLSDSGLYECIVSNTCKVATSQSATLTLAEPAAVVADPLSQTTCTGTAVIFSAGVAGFPPFIYQWWKDGVPLAGETADLMIVDPVTPENAGAYDVSVVNVCGEDLSNVATLTVPEALEITAQPSDQIVCSGSTVTFEVAATGAGELLYQWSRDGEDLEGATAATLSIDDAGADNTGVYSVLVSDDCDAVMSRPAVVAIEEVAQVITEPTDQTVCPGDAALLETIVGGAPPLTFQWFKDDDEIPDAESATLSLPVVTLEDLGEYSLRVSNRCSSVVTATATVNLLNDIQIVSQPTSAPVCRGSPLTLAVEATGSAPLAYQWRHDGVNIEDAEDTTYAFDTFMDVDVGAYDVIITGTCGTATSLAAILTLEAAPELTSQPLGLTVCRDAPVLFEVTATGTEPIAFQWRRDGEDLPGANAASLTIDAADTVDAGVYDVVVTNTCDSIISNTAELVFREPTLFTTQPSSQLLCIGDATVLSAFVTGSEPLNYQWRKDGEKVSGATDPTYPLPLVTAADAGSYDLRVTNDCGEATSETVVLVTEELVQLTSQPVGGRRCDGAEILLSATAVGTPPLEFQWRKDGVILAGETEPDLVLSSLTSDDSGDYQVAVSNRCSSVTSEVAVVRASVCFHRGDVDSSGDLDITDGIAVFNLLFLGRGETSCLETADVNNDGDVDVSDGIRNVNYLFLGGEPPVAPGPPGMPCDLDPDPLGSPQDLGCERYDSCL
jgi:hypothetical protein